ncbi:MAG: LPS export ABC transporter permease LptG [Alphaproteobacteria bacterium]|jgi:lipopolysaccharide export system permease protein|nr:LPS export ABC transporter permease LptG [Alphaproteobacteria bacterium]MBT4086452.1 LPS export ABC transporter permease LptG [Alphaproteobacteria bacterium]MBT4546432.1 LPS export ABC transporter permease LptG [Alphaproteobacteria bacterium]MBT7747673.1 LPS export ABC transporter permease LptG [Alphaproteobacteria bacterium]
MRISPVLSFYIAKRFLLDIGLIFAVLLGLIFIGDLVELMRRAWNKDTVTIWLTIELALLKLPYMAQKVAPFSALFGCMLAFVRLTRTHQLVVARSAGISVWQFMLPAVAIAFIGGGLMVTIFNPLVSATMSRFEQLEAEHFRGRASSLAVSASGLWLRQADAGGQSVIHALRVTGEGTELENVIIFLYSGKDRFTGRIDAKSAVLEPGYWRLNDALVTAPNETAIRHKSWRLKTTLTLEQIQDSFASPDTMSFWDLPDFINTLEAAGFSALRHRLHWHSLLAAPLLLFAMVLLAASFSLRLTRSGGIGLLMAGGVGAGFLLYFLTDVSLALGMSGGIPVILAAWAPALTSTLLGLATLLHLEDG